MDFSVPADDDPRRSEVRRWLAENPSPSGRELAEAGYVAPQWPRPWGIEADPVTALVIDEELSRAGVSIPDNPMGIGWVGPAILAAGSEQQRQRYLFPILSGAEIWCQLFSEPEAGSDLAAVRIRAERAGDHYLVNGQKIWTSYAERSQFGILIARTSVEPPKHRGLSYFICPMDTPGITVRPLREMTGGYHFNETFFEDVRIPVANRIGVEGQGWELTKLTLANERLKISRGGICWGMGPSSADLFELVRARGGVADPLLRDRLAQLYIEKEIIRLLGYQIISRAADQTVPGPEASIKKALSDEHGQRLLETAKDLAGPAGVLENVGPLGSTDPAWPWAFLFARSLTIGGGTSEVQRNILAERILGLPREPAAN